MASGESAGVARIVLLAITVAAAAFAAGCDQPSANTDGKKAGAAAPAAAPLAQVTVSQPLIKELVEWDEYTGRFDAVEQVEVRTRVSGHLQDIGFKDGQTIKKGDLLYVLDPRPFERALEQARAELAQARTKAENATLDVERGRPLMERKVLSEKAYDDRANVLRDAQASIKVAEAKVATAELDLSFTRIASPIDGVASRSLVTPGNWVNAGTISTATMLTTIVRQNPVYIYFDVSENNYLKYKRLLERGDKAGAAQAGAEVGIAMPDEKGYPHKGRLDFIDNRLDPGTATLRARAIVDNPNGLFSPGMFARVRIAGSARYNAVLVPDSVIATDQASKFVLVVTEAGEAQRRAVVTGPVTEGNMRIVRSGLNAEDWVIVKGARTRSGQKVEAKRQPLAQSVAAPVTAAPAVTAQPQAKN